MFLRLLFASWRARRGRLALALTAVTLGIGVTVALATLALEVGDDLAKSLRAAGPNFVVLPPGGSLDVGGEEIEPRLDTGLPLASVARTRSGFWRNNILEAAPERSLPVRLGGEPVTLLGTWFDHTIETPAGAWRTGVGRLHPQWRVTGAWPNEGARELALGAALARTLGLSAGSTIDLARGEVRESWRVTGIVQAGGDEDDRAWAPLGEVQRLGGRPDEVDRVWLSALVKPMPRGAAPDAAKDPAAYERFMCTAYPPNVAGDVAARLGGGAEVRTMTEVVAGEGRVVERLNLLMLLLALAALAAATLGLVSTTTATVVERGPELGLLRALGATGGQIAALLLGETLLVALPGGAIGWLIGSLAAGAIRGGAFGTGSPVQPLLLPLAILVALLLALLGTIGPLRLAMRIDPVAVLKA